PTCHHLQKHQGESRSDEESTRTFQRAWLRCCGRGDVASVPAEAGEDSLKWSSFAGFASVASGDVPYGIKHSG
ncbi:MAG TPA: hypothetical protein VHD63_28305, partial [Ktedonobacteraceae bacterium]|nr:hypothetical protein [Ktedonobacteraceae bacterium]